MKKVYVFANGCVPNRLEAKKIIDICSEQGWEVCNNKEEADMVIFNSCGFCGEKIKESKEIINKFCQGLENGKELILTGCLPKIDPSVRENKCNYKSLDISKIGKILDSDKSLNSMFVSGSITDVLATTRKDIYHLLTSQGCKGECSYCVIKRAKGSIISKPVEKINEEFLEGIQKGYRKFILWGEDLGAYGHDLSISILDLLKSLLDINFKDIEYSLYLHRYNPQWVLLHQNELKEILKSNKIKMIYSPIQSGSDRILKLMNRFYTAGAVKKCFKKLKMEFPHVILKTDIMVGFPTENEEDFNDTLKFVDENKFDDVALFKYSGISNTDAFEMKEEISEEVKDFRISKFWLKFPYLRYNLEVIDKQGWIVDYQKILRKGPFRLNPYS